MRRLIVLSAALLSACASSNRTDPAAQATERTVDVLNTNGTVPVSMRTTHVATQSGRSYRASADAVWNALPAVYAGLGIPIAERDPATRTIGNPSYKLRRRLGDLPLSRVLDCGSTQGSPSADTYEVLLSVNTKVSQVTADSVEVVTLVDGRARPVAFTADYVNCGSLGALEKRFFDRLAVELKH